MRFAVVVLLGVLTWVCCLWWDYREPRAPTEIFRGITYGCARVEATKEGSGLVHWVRIDLTAPGIELFITPLDRSAVAQGWQYRLRRTEDVVKSEQLAVAINGTLFTSNSGWLRMSGDLAKSVETVVSDHQVSHLSKETYLLWFDDVLSPHLEQVEAAKGIGARSGQVWYWRGRGRIARRQSLAWCQS